MEAMKAMHSNMKRIEKARLQCAANPYHRVRRLCGGLSMIGILLRLTYFFLAERMLNFLSR